MTAPHHACSHCQLHVIVVVFDMFQQRTRASHRVQSNLGGMALCRAQWGLARWYGVQCGVQRGQGVHQVLQCSLRPAAGAVQGAVRGAAGPAWGHCITTVIRRVDGHAVQNHGK